MAISSQELRPASRAAVYRFPTAAVRARAARERRRRRLRGGGLGVVAVVALLLLTLSGSGPGTATAGGHTPRRVTVAPGETLWGIAARYAPPERDPRAFVDALVELNELSGPVQVGERLRLP